MNYRSGYSSFAIILCLVAIPNPLYGMAKSETIYLGLEAYLCNEDALSMGPPFGVTITTYPSTIDVGCVLDENRMEFTTYTANFYFHDLTDSTYDYWGISLSDSGQGLPSFPHYFNLTLTYTEYPGESFHNMRIECYSSNNPDDPQRTFDWMLFFENN